MKKDLKLVVIEDEKILRVSITDELRGEGYDVVEFEDPASALTAIKKNHADVVITDIKMPKMNGIEFLSKCKSIKPETVVIVMTAYGSVHSAVQAMKEGAYEYITKPFEMDELFLLLERIREFTVVKEENIRLRSHFKSRYGLESFMGKGEYSRQILEMVKTISRTPTTVLLDGETGTGKDLLANIIHYNSDRSNMPFVKVGCAVFSPTVFESELFGHEKGAFTGAVKDRKGRFEEADGGTIYLDDVDDIPIDLQVKLLRVLEEQEFERVGSNRTYRVDVRMLVSTKTDLKKLVQEGEFRKDLYYRLNVFPIHLIPLRERKEDIPILTNYFIEHMAPGAKINVREDVMNLLKEQPWPGNVRELKNTIERMLLISNGGDIDVSCFAIDPLHPETVPTEICIGRKPLDKIISEVESNIISEALQRTGGSQVRAANLLGIPPSTLRTKITKYGLK